LEESDDVKGEPVKKIKIDGDAENEPDLFSDDEELKDLGKSSAAAPLDFVGTIASKRKRGGAAAGHTRVNKHFKMKLCKEAHVSKNLPEVADMYGVTVA
jgi:hypothetical protein